MVASLRVQRHVQAVVFAVPQLAHPVSSHGPTAPDYSPVQAQVLHLQVKHPQHLLLQAPDYGHWPVARRGHDLLVARIGGDAGAGGGVVMDDDTLLLPCGAGYGNYREGDAGVLFIMSSSLVPQEQANRCWPGGSPPFCRR